MKRLLMFAILACAVLLPGCATVAGVAGTQIKQVTVEDIDAAIELARIGEDADGMACWQAVKAAMPAGGGAATVKIAGVASGWQAARNVRRGIQAGIDPVVHRACAVLVVDAEQTAGKLGLRGVALVK